MNKLQLSGLATWVKGFVAVFLACLVVVSALAQSNTATKSEWSRNFETKVTVGDGDSRVKARELALDQIKRQAANGVGSVVENVAVLQDEHLTEQLRMVSVAMVKLDQVKEFLSVDGNGVAVLNVSARATVDASELDRMGRELRQDGEKAKAIAKLQLENQSLRDDLSRVRQQLTQRKEVRDLALLNQQQDSLLGAIRNNENQVRQVFAEGVLLAMAKEDERAMAAIQDKLDRTVLLPILSSPVHAKVASVVKDGPVVHVGVRVGWDLDLAQIRRSLSPYMNTGYSEGPNVLVFSNRANSDERVVNDKTMRVKSYLSKQRISLIISVAGNDVTLPVMRPVTEPFISGSCIHSGDEAQEGKTDLCFYSQPFQAARVEGFHLYGPEGVNPITVDIPVAAANGPVSVTTRWVWQGSGRLVKQTDPEVAKALR